MEDALRVQLLTLRKRVKVVLILVLMEDALREILETLGSHFPASVLILVLMEDALRVCI